MLAFKVDITCLRVLCRTVSIAIYAPFVLGVLPVCAQNFDLSSSVPLNAPNMATRTYYDGAETIGRVGHEAILRRDVLHQLKKIAHLHYLDEVKKIPEEQREKVQDQLRTAILTQYLNSDEAYTRVLDEHIRKLLFYCDYVTKRPKDQVKEQTSQLEKEFDLKMVPELEKNFNCKSLKELEEYFENEIQSDFAQEKRIFIQHTLGELWMNYNLGEEDFEPTLNDLRRYYEANTDLYKTETKVRWQAMTVRFGVNRTKEDAKRKIVHMGNAVQAAPLKSQEALFAEVCRVDSEDSWASQGGYRNWTGKGVLRSEVIENAIFSDALPVGQMSMILEDKTSFTIVRVLEREKERVKSFAEVQEEVHDKLVEDRKKAMEQKYQEKLSEEFTIEVYAITPEEREKCFRSAKREETSATGRAPIY